jgi:hypothetical protein
MMPKIISGEETGKDSFCDGCKEPCKTKAVDQSFSYAGTHCSHGRDGVHHEIDILSDCCEEDFSDGKFWLCKCGNEVEFHIDMEPYEMICQLCKRTGCFTDEF